jgi:hypothetical protein
LFPHLLSAEFLGNVTDRKMVGLLGLLKGAGKIPMDALTPLTKSLPEKKRVCQNFLMIL